MRSMAFARSVGARLSLGLCFAEGTLDDAAGFTSCYGLRICFIRLFRRTFHRASAAGFRRRLPASYGAAWPFPRL